MLITTGPFAGMSRKNARLILADPAWAFVTYSGESVPQRAEEQHYPVMRLAELKALPVVDLAYDDCALVMWVIGSHLDQALELGRAWGFTYKTDLFTWVKTGKHDPAVRPISLGMWSRKQTEQALIFTRGKPKRLDAGIRQLFETDEHIIFAPKREHSRKPEEQYERLQRLVAGPYVELFARAHRPGWEVWGNQVDRFDIKLPSIFEDLLGNSTGSRSINEFEELLG